MISDMLPAYIEAALEEAGDQLAALAAGPQPLRGLIATSDNLRIVGVGELFTMASSAALRARLHQSGRSFAHGLAQLPAADRLGSKLRPFFDSIAADDDEAARAIAALARRAWAIDKEFEEDFLFVESLMQRFYLAPDANPTQLLERWQACLNETGDPRLEVVRALVDQDSEAFDAALPAYLDDRAERLEAHAAKESLPGAFLATELHFSVEGVALAKLARAGGLEIRSQYRHVPAPALEAATENWAASDWWRITAVPA